MRHVDCGDCWTKPQCESCAQLEAEIVAHTIRSPEAEAYWRERIGQELEANALKAGGYNWFKEAATFVRGKTQEG